MRRPDPDLWAGILVTLLGVATGVPVLLVQLAGDDPTTGPRWLWWLTFAAFVVTLVTSTWGMETLSRRWLLGTFGLQVVLAPAIVLLAPGVGWTPIVLVFTAALSPYLLGPRTTTAIVALNTVVAGAAAGLARGVGFEIVLTGAIYLLLQSVSVLAVVSQRRDQASRRELAEAHTELRATSALLADATRAAERLRIARDLHDVIGHQVTALALELEVASHHSTPPASEHVTRARRIAKDLLADLRATVGQLREETPELRGALEAVVADLPRPVVHLRVDDGLAVDETRRTVLVRCVQEVVTNAIRHAEADNLWIDVTRDEHGGAVLVARDDGRGSRPLTLGNGLRGMRERVEALGGRARFASDGGFCVHATVPAP